MRRGSAVIESIRIHTCGNPVVQLICPRALTPGPGQAVMAHKPGSLEALRHPLFPVEIRADGFAARAPQGTDWTPGSHLDLWGPLARGFQPPPDTRRWLLVSHGEWSGALYPLIHTGLRQSVAIALLTAVHVSGLPQEIEILTELSPAMAWADYLAAEVAIRDLQGLRQALILAEGLGIPRGREVMIRSELACGFGACGACAVPSRRHWRLSCVEGPVFDFKTLGW